MIENLVKSLTKSIFAKISAKYDADIAAMKADIAELKNPVVPAPEQPITQPTQPALPPSRPANIQFVLLEDEMGAYPVGEYNGHRYDFDITFEPSTDSSLQVLRHINNFSMTSNYSNLEVVGEGMLDVIVTQRMYDLDSNVVFINRVQYSRLLITAANQEYLTRNVTQPLMPPDRMHFYVVNNRPAAIDF